MSFLLISGHDFRSPRKANVHFIAAELALRGKTRMFSIGFSPLSHAKGKDPRLGMTVPANTPGMKDGVECYLWRTFAHPFNPRHPALQVISPLAFETYRALSPPILREWVEDASTIFVESGLGVLWLADFRRWNAKAEIIYIASDDMATIGVDPYLLRLLRTKGHLIDGVRVPSRTLASVMPGNTNVFYVPHGIDESIADLCDPSPYKHGVHAVSVGSMLFDPQFFAIAAAQFPEITFHVIGSGARREQLPPAVVMHAEMPFAETLPYIKHARFGIAPYRQANVPYYLSDTSMKLMQYEFLRIPAVCPYFVVGNHPTRHGYQPGDAASISDAIRGALAAKPTEDNSFLNWSNVVDRLLNPRAFTDTRIDLCA